ncbi:peptide ABC transporter ATP-binding protein [Salipiger aestuarii]|uniref:ABC transporter ATP-binding protein n=1 Tax=Salipiger aestuarii TaxID=568098 RepID=UPI00025B6A06|nr:oligopeptide/dipeptide ABC transporter ATP-binding protein [Salipiger aestuarii]EIE51530.1 oligopeptide ABC transporter ATP-binding protein [Citreicella sp. 357]KAA8608453.1 peptide ABC transporter ATP-binding protein [Salipiger aestuarii]KAA8612270.1 peptide ABC transporter ATP-binding protein [Salipiger aestuarii]
MLLTVDALRVIYPIKRGWPVPGTHRLTAVDGVGFSVDTGEALGIVGESGCGKSTVARAILRLVEPSAGKVVFAGVDIARLPLRRMRHLRPKLQMIFQDPAASLSPRMRIGAALAEAIRVHDIAKGNAINDLVRNALDEVGLPPNSVDRYPHEFSGGQKQRIGIARALVLSPDLIIADEPVSALDVSVQAQILNLMARLKAERGIAFVFISHDLGVVRHFCERTSVMYLGQVIESGATRAIFDAPAHPYTRLLRSVSPVPDPERTAAPLVFEGEPPSPLDPPDGCRFHPRCPFATGVCRTTMPDLRPVAARQVACHHAESLPANEDAP